MSFLNKIGNAVDGLYSLVKGEPKVEISGVHERAFLPSIDEECVKFLKKISREVKGVRKLRVHVKETLGTKRREEVHATLELKHGMLFAKGEGTELYDALSQALDKLDSGVRKEKSKEVE
jgi:ribosomal subunit interface protein